MPNYKVFQDLPSSLRTRLYGVSGSSDIAVVVDSSGVLAIQDNGSSITVDASNLDIRDLTEASDSILIYGNDGSNNQVILTDSSGRLKTLGIPDFTEATQTVATATADAFSTTRNVSQFLNYSFFVENTSLTNTAALRLEISPDDSTYLVEGTEVTIPVSTSIVLQPDRYLKYSHVSYRSTTAGSDATLVLIWQAATA
ncbi:MAG: DUF6385 domain-containing protein [Bacillota bacterium]|nr:DUF6385 domain-containing protein [Bacillota bacterium]